MDAKDLRHEAEVIHEWADNRRVKDFCTSVLRILDAFEAMEREGLSLTYVKHMDGSTSYWLCKPESPVIHSGGLIQALLAAADTLKEPTDG